MAHQASSEPVFPQLAPIKRYGAEARRAVARAAQAQVALPRRAVIHEVQARHSASGYRPETGVAVGADYRQISREPRAISRPHLAAASTITTAPPRASLNDGGESSMLPRQFWDVGIGQTRQVEKHVRRPRKWAI